MSRDFFKQKVLLIFGYNGKNYHGLQVQKSEVDTVESKLYDALKATNMVGVAKIGDLQQLAWSRGARTDKGVHALCNGIAVKLCFGKQHLIQDVKEQQLEQIEQEQQKKFKKGEDKFKINFKTVMNELNSNLPLDIKIHSIKLTTQGFDVRKWARSRIYEYIIPTAVYGEEPEKQLERLKLLIKKFEGTHNFHNYSRGLLFKDASSMRYILKMEVEQFEYKGQQFYKFLLQGQSFVYHQIRKMMGIIIQLFAENLPDTFIDNTFFQNQLRIILAPPEGLFLNRITFDAYNRKLEIPEPIELSEEDLSRINQFRPIIVNHICDQEIENYVFTKWINHLKENNFILDEPIEEVQGGDE
ncbi:hypothetical protein pb186bvf_003033 [Paramecium bursaria]